MEKPSLPLNVCHVLEYHVIINRLYMFILAFALSALFYYRATTISRITKTKESPLLPHLLIGASELFFTFIWVLHQAYRWRPVVRAVHPERLPAEENFPAVDVFIFTADPSKEPSLGVMNTVLSAMALDYPLDKLAVYLSDDAGSYVTLNAVREAWEFSKLWIPFCRKYQLNTRCPQVYISSDDDCDFVGSNDYVADKKEIQRRYDEFRENLEKNSVNAESSVGRDHGPTVEVMNYANGEAKQDMPLLVYVAREKRPSQPHNFKAGAANALIRVSALISNAPYLLLLDCDHFCNDPTSARQAMCYFLDPEISPELAFVQFPQRFHNISKHDIYEGRLCYFWRRWLGSDGLEGPFISGCNLYLKRETLYGTTIETKDVDFNSLRSFGSSNVLIKSIYNICKPQLSKDSKSINALGKELELLASCTYDSRSEWGKEVGFVYYSVVEDFMTSLIIHSRGWKSVWIDPPRPCFLGSCPTNLSDSLVQQSRWGIGLMQVALSKYCPLVYGRERMSMLHRMCYAALSFDPAYVIPFYGISIVPQICLLHGIPLYPKVSDPFFLVVAFIFFAAQLKHVQEVVSYENSFMASLYELRGWMMRSASSYLHATSGAILEKFGLKKAHFTLTNKAVNDDQTTRYYQGIYDFQASPLLVAPICSLYILNLACIIMGIERIVRSGNGDELFLQALIPLFGVIVNFHVFQGMVMRNDRGRVSPHVSLVSCAVAVFILSFGSLTLVY